MHDEQNGAGQGRPTNVHRSSAAAEQPQSAQARNDANVIQFANWTSNRHTKVANVSEFTVNTSCSLETTRAATRVMGWGETSEVRVGTYELPELWDNAINGWLLWLMMGGLRPATLRVRRGQMRMIARRSGTRGPSELTLALIVAISSESKWSNEHRKGVRTSLNSFYEWAVDNGHATINPAATLPRVAVSKPRPRPCPDDIWRNLLATAPPRERLMARLAGEVGMRRAEVAQCHRNDLMHDGVAWSILVHGKGGRQRVVPVTEQLAHEIRKYCPGGYLFRGQVDGHISAHYVGKQLSKLMPEGWSMHKLRHRFATRGYAATGNLRAVQEALGHASVATTQIYTAVATSDVRAVSEGAAWHDTLTPA